MVMIRVSDDRMVQKGFRIWLELGILVKYYFEIYETYKTLIYELLIVLDS